MYERAGTSATGPTAWALVWERSDSVDIVIVDAHDSTVLSVGSSDSPG